MINAVRADGGFLIDADIAAGAHAPPIRKHLDHRCSTGSAGRVACRCGGPCGCDGITGEVDVQGASDDSCQPVVHGPGRGHSEQLLRRAVQVRVEIDIQFPRQDDVSDVASWSRDLNSARDLIVASCAEVIPPKIPDW
jgi:hypothetical protein